MGYSAINCAPSTSGRQLEPDVARQQLQLFRISARAVRRHRLRTCLVAAASKPAAGAAGRGKVQSSTPQAVLTETEQATPASLPSQGQESNSRLPSVQNGTTAATKGLEADAAEDNDNSLLVGKLACLAVALLWGSYAPALRMVYSMDGPPGPVAVMLFRGVLQAAVLLTADSIASRGAGGDQQAGGPGPVGVVVPEGATWLQRLRAENIVMLGGLELGLWNYMATAVQTVGLQLTTATKAGFLIASTSLITPLLSSLLGDRPQASTWVGSFIALSGTILIAADKVATDGDTGGGGALIAGGDLCILGAAFFYSLATVRLSSYARVVPPVKLAAAKSVVLASAAICTAIAAVWVTQDVEELWPGWRTSYLAWGVLIWSALGPGAMAAFLHAKGQSVVPAADAQVIFSSTPLWSAAAAWVLLGGEPVSSKTWIGGAAIVVAGIVASRKWRPG